VQAAMSAAVCAFETVKGAADTVIQTLQSGIPIARSELLCATTMAALNRHNKTSHREMPTLLLEFHGTEAGVVEQAEMVQEIAREHGGLDFQWATKPEERTKLWEARHHAYFACLQLRPGSRAISTDVCVPISRLAECIVETTKDIDKASMPIPLFGHVGDGNFHLVILIDPASKSDMEEAKAINLRVVQRALAMEGTCTGEHGIGLGKQAYLVEELGEAVDLMRDLKRTFDPQNLLNPGKVVPL
jgi:D-lactate dehydrogenase (cytochrome)